MRTGILLLLGLLAGFVGLAPSAFAHHAYVQGNVASVCDAPTGKIKVTFDVKSWATVSSGDRVLNSSIGIQYRLGNTSTFPGVTSPLTGFSADVTTGVFTNNNSGGIPSFSGSFLLDASNAGKYLQLRSYPKGNWTNLAGTSSLAPNPEGDDSFVVAIDPLKTGCTPATPSATASVVCAASKITVSFTGVGSATTVDVTKNGSAVAGGTGRSVPVGPSTFDVPLTAADENTTVTIGLNYAAASAVDQTLSVPVDCQTPAVPSADVQWTCGANATVLLGNSGQETIQATILKNGSPVFSNIDVPPGGTNRVVSITGADENTLVTIKVTFADVGTATDHTEAFTVDCDKPAPTIGTPVCAEGGLNVVLGNVQGTDAATFTIVIGGVESTETVAAGTSKTVLIPVAEDATVSVSITSGDQSYADEALTRDCEKPAATVVFGCAVGGVRVALTNAGELPVAVNVNGEQVVVPAGTTADAPITRTIPVAEGASYSITVLDQTAAGTRDCEKPDATLVFECAEGGVVVTLTNTGELATSVLVNGSPTNVPAGGTPVIVKIPVVEGAAYNVTVTGDGLNKSIAGTRDCEKPAVGSVTLECAEGGVLVVLTNSGESDSTVTVDGVEVNVPAGTAAEAPVTVLVPVDENAAYDFTVVGDGLDEHVTGTADCLLPEAVVVGLTCAKGGLNVNLRNDGDDTATFVLTSPALPDGEVTVAVDAGGTEAVHVSLAEEASTDLTVTSDDEVLVEDTITRDCETVEGGVTRPPAPLPRTGADSTGLLALAGALLLAGVALVTGGRRREAMVR